MPDDDRWMTHAGVRPPPEIRLEPEYHAPFAAWHKAPTPANASRLLGALKPTIAQGVKAYGGANDNPMLRSHAKRLALDALRTYDPKGRPLRNHVLTHLQGLQRYAAKQTQMLSVPEKVAIDKQRLDAGEAELRDLHGRDPSTAELQDHLSMPMGRIAYVRQYKPGFAQGQAEAAIPGSEGEEGGDPAVDQGDNTAAKVAFIYHDLDPTSQAIVEHGFGLHGRPALKMQDIARKLNLSNGAVSQRSKRIQQMLDQMEDTGVF